MTRACAAGVCSCLEQVARSYVLFALGGSSYVLLALGGSKLLVSSSYQLVPNTYWLVARA